MPDVVVRSFDLVALPHHATVVATSPLSFGVLDLGRDGPVDPVRGWSGSALVFLQPSAPDRRPAPVRWFERVRLVVVNRWWCGLLDDIESRRQGARNYRDPDDR